MADLETAKNWLRNRFKVKPKSWRNECFIFWDEDSLCCRDEKKEVIDISKLADEDWGIYYKDFCLSDKEEYVLHHDGGCGIHMYRTKGIKEFIKKIKEIIDDLEKRLKRDFNPGMDLNQTRGRIDKLAGKKLT